jgi:hypothetical protein
MKPNGVKAVLLAFLEGSAGIKYNIPYYRKLMLVLIKVFKINVT